MPVPLPRLAQRYFQHIRHAFFSSTISIRVLVVVPKRRYLPTMTTKPVTTATIATKVEQPPWQPPSTSTSSTPSSLAIYNSLTRTKTPFIPIDPSGRKVTWYCCGPTVYDAGHLGHARNYVTTDVIRRIVEGYFGYEVQFVQNVTDIDDKIILRARQSHLFQQFVEKNSVVTEEALGIVAKAWQSYFDKVFPRAELKTGDATEVVTGEATSQGPPPPPKATPETFLKWASTELPQLINSDGSISNAEPQNRETAEMIEAAVKTKMHLKTLATAAAVLNTPPSSTETFYTASKDVLAPYLDQKDGHRVTDQKVFRETAAYWEKHFNTDMATLNVLPPTITTRVSEFVPENVKFVETLVSKGFAYPTADGSVYFNVESYRDSGHSYAKLQPWNASVDALLKDGEGALTEDTGKKSKGDFALWKSSKPGEPGWDSPWGKGRPGWHIECSVMCSEVLGNRVDIHSGGIDLAFPHHDNEIAQSEAYWDPCTATSPGKKGEKHQWVNYFIHMGHLEISGAKMSKSLKNFTGIREALAKGGGWTARTLRIVFLQGSWKDRIEIREGVIAAAKSWEGSVGKFFTQVKSLRSEQEVEEASGESAPQLFGEREHALYKDFDTARQTVHDALCDSFNTSLAMSAIADLVSKSNVYLGEKSYKSIAVLSAIARWVTKMVNTFGLDIAPTTATTIGWSESDSADAVSGGANKENIAMPYVRVLSNFRDKVRAMAVADAKNPAMQQLLSLCDLVRDEDLPTLGVSLDDRDTAAGKPALVKFVPAEQLLAERKEKEAKAAEKEAGKARAKQEADRKAAEKLEEGKLSPLQMFKEGKEGENWSAWDEDGLPTKDKGGEEVTKSRTKALKKAWEKQKKSHEAYLTWEQSQGEADE